MSRANVLKTTGGLSDKETDQAHYYSVLDWKRLTGIHIYNDIFSSSPPEIYKLIAYVDDVKPSITSMQEFSLVDYGSSLFEAASGCHLHRDPASGKVKFLPLGRWKGTLTIEDLPVKYVALSEHLDMVGVQLMANYQKTRKVNCDDLQTKVQNIVGSWRGGKFMPLTNRAHSLNTFCLSKVWYKCSSINIRVCDHKKITSNVRSWLFADQLEKPEEHIVTRSRKDGGLGLANVQYKALALLIRSFLETLIIPNFKHNKYHEALFSWYVEEKRNIVQPSKPPYYDDTFFASIKMVKDEGLLNLKTMTTAMWYRVLVEENVTHRPAAPGRELVPCRAEQKHPDIDWGRTWSLSTTSGLPSIFLTFLWRMVYDLLPCQTRLFSVTLMKLEICSIF